MTYALLYGALLGFVAAIPVGPVNAAVIDTAMRKCVRRAIAIGAGGAFMDMLYSQLAVLGLRGLMQQHPAISNAALLVGGIVLVVFGWKTATAPPPPEPRTASVVTPRLVPRALAAAFLGGVLITIANPACLLSWLAISGALLSDLTRLEALAAGVGIFVGCTLWFVGIAWLASIGRVRLGARSRWIGRVVGSSLVIYGAFLVCKAGFVVFAAARH